MSGVTMSRAERLGHTAPSTARVVGEVLVASVVAGVAMGVLWWVLAPEVTGFVVDGELLADLEQGQKLFGRDAVFALLGSAFGLVLGVVFTARHRRRPVTSLLTLALAGVGGSLLAQFTGAMLGPDGDVSGLAEGTDHAFALQMDTPQALIVWPLVATVMAAVIALFREDTTPWSASGPPAQL